MDCYCVTEYSLEGEDVKGLFRTLDEARDCLKVSSQKEPIFGYDIAKLVFDENGFLVSICVLHEETV